MIRHADQTCSCKIRSLRLNKQANKQKNERETGQTEYPLYTENLLSFAEARVTNSNNDHFEVAKATNGLKNGSAEGSMLTLPDLTS